MYIFAAKRCIRFWLRLINLPRDRYTRLCYEMLMYYDSIGYKNWVTDIRLNLYKNGFGYVWEAQVVANPKLFIVQYEQRLKDQFVQNWQLKCLENVKLNHYVMFKTTFKSEKYISVIDIDKYRKCFASFRSSSHCLMVEKGRHFNIDREHRDCMYCESMLEDEYHFLIVCSLYANLRSYYIPLYYYQYPNVQKFYSLMATEDESLIRNVAMYIYYAMKERDNFLKCFE
jgi:hypothetical protein